MVGVPELACYLCSCQYVGTMGKVVVVVVCTYKDLLPWNPRPLPPAPNLRFVSVERGGVDVAVSDAQGVFDGAADFVRFGELVGLAIVGVFGRRVQTQVPKPMAGMS